MFHSRYGEGTFQGYLMGHDNRGHVEFDDKGYGRMLVWTSHLVRSRKNKPRWAQVRPGDTAEFDVQGDVLKIKARGEERQATVLGFKTTELDGVWDLLSIKQRNPPVPTRFGARVTYRDKQWLLIYSAMVITDHKVVGDMIWVEVNQDEFNWVGHQDIDRETFEVIFTGWVAP